LIIRYIFLIIKTGCVPATRKQSTAYPLIRLSVFLAFSAFLVFPAFSQDTLRVMHYNLLNYGNITSYCTSSNNSVQVKNAAFRTVIAHVSPHILTVNEISDLPYYHEEVLDSVLEPVFPGRYARAGFSNANGSDIVNDLYYDQDRVVLEQAYGIYCDVRDADAYALALLPEVPGGDTAHLMCIVTHLKAGSGTDDEQDRATMASDILNWLTNMGFTGNILLMGDMNLKSSYEPAWYNLTQFPNAAVRFYDPVNQPGNWTGGSSFRKLHSQSTHTSSNGCAAGGGLDDRFDLILSSLPLLEGSNGLQYVHDSYDVVGQDGLRLNGSVISPPNTDVPDSVAQALYAMSDHLPVTVLLRYGPGTPVEEREAGALWLLNPSAERIQLWSARPLPQAEMELYTMEGRLLWQGPSPAGESHFVLPPVLQAGTYLLRFRPVHGWPVSLKAVVK